MDHDDCLDAERMLRQTLNLCNVDDLKKLVALLPGGALKAPRKLELVGALEGALLGDGARQLWSQLPPLERSAVMEAVHSGDGALQVTLFHSKYGALPAFEIEEKNGWRRNPTLLCLFLFPAPLGGRSIPADLREKLRAFVPKPSAARLSSVERIPERSARPWESQQPDDATRSGVDREREDPLVERMTEQAAMQDLRTVLRLVDQEKISVSEKTLLPSKGTTTLLNDLLCDHDYFDPTQKVDRWDPGVGPLKAFSWPLLVQAAKFAALRNGKLLLTRNGRAALEAPPAQALREIWNAWVTKGILDEFSRIDAIKGQKRKGSGGLTPPKDRRLTIQTALAECPVGRWVEIEEFSRYMRAAGFHFEVTGNRWALYICDPQYGHLGYEGYGGWNILQERYLLCLLFEYAAPLGLIDIAYEHPAGARCDFSGQWGTDDLSCLSRYDGLRYFRLTPLGAFVLGLAKDYEAPKGARVISLTVLPNRQIRIDGGDLAPDQRLLLGSFGEPQSAGVWALDEARALKSVQKGARVAELRSFLAAGDPQPLPEAVEGFLSAVEQRGAACTCKGTALLIECISPQVAGVIAHNPQTARFCQRTGERGLVVPLDKEKSFRDALNSIGYGMPQV